MARIRCFSPQHFLCFASFQTEIDCKQLLQPFRRQIPGALLHDGNSTQTSLSWSSQIRTTIAGWLGKKMLNTVGQQIAHHSEHQDRSAHLFQPDVGDKNCFLRRMGVK